MGETYQIALSVGALTLLFWLEWAFPFFLDRKDHLKHSAKNVFLGLLNLALVSLLFSALTVSAAIWAEKQSIGLVHTLELQQKVAFAFVFILFDLWMYAWHRANHNISFLWLFHRVHHSDPKMDASTALRFHPGEIFISSALRIPIIVLLGMQAYDLIAYETCLSIVILFHHSNVKVPKALDKILSFVIVTPNIHRVHHSDKVSETNSNYASIFSCWDRIFYSAKKRVDQDKIHYGLKEFRDDSWHTVWGMLKTPFVRIQKK